MAHVEIHYCVPCGLLPPALEVQERLLSSLGQELEGVTLRTGHGGVFTVSVDGQQVFDQAEDGYDPEAILAAVKQRL